jgi:hypothetical protein
MMRIAQIIVAAIALLAMIGCKSGEVSTSDVEKWQNEGREAGDKPVTAEDR